MARSLPSSATRQTCDLSPGAPCSWPMRKDGWGVGRRYRHNPHSQADDRLPSQGMRGFAAGIC